MFNGHLTIGELAKQTGCKVQTIRFYEQIGLMPEALRTEGNQRRFGQAHLERLTFVRHSRELGFPLSAIRELLRLGDNPKHSCEAVDRIARQHLHQVESRIARLEALRSELRRISRQCRGGRMADCRIIKALAGHPPIGAEY